MVDISAAEAGVTITKEFKIGQWLAPVDEIVPAKGPLGEPVTRTEKDMMLQVDPENPRLSSQDSRGSTPLMIPDTTPDGSYATAVYLEKKATVEGEKDKMRVDVYRIHRTGDRFTAQKISSSAGLGNVIADFAAEELPVGMDPEAVEARKNVKRATPDTATAQAFSQRRKETESHFWRLPSRSPMIEVGLLPAVDVASLKATIQQRLNTSVRNTEMGKQPVPAAQPAG